MSDTYSASGCVQQHRVDGSVRDQQRALARGLDPHAHVAREVARQLERRHALGELRLVRHLLERDRRDRSPDVRPVGPERERDAVAMRDVARAREDELAVAIGVPADVVDVQVRQEDDVDLVRRDTGGRERGQQPLLPLRRPAPEPRRPDAGVHQHRRAAGADQVRRARDPPLRAGEELRIERPVRLPVVEARDRARRALRAGRPRRRAARARPSRLPPHARRRRLAVRLLPADHRVAEHADPLDLGLDHVAGLQVERGRVLGEAGDAATRSRSRARRPAEYPSAE